MPRKTSRRGPRYFRKGSRRDAQLAVESAAAEAKEQSTLALATPVENLPGAGKQKGAPIGNVP